MPNHCTHNGTHTLVKILMKSKDTIKPKFVLSILALLLPLIPLYPALFTRAIVRRDALWLFSPHLSYLQRSIRAFHIPLWNPYIFTGQPELASAQWGTLYPIEWIGLFVMPVYWYIKISLYFHMILLFLAGWDLTKEWYKSNVATVSNYGLLMGAIGITFSGFALGHMDAGHISFVQSLPWYILGISWGIKWLHGWRWGWITVPLGFSVAIMAGGIAILPYFVLLALALWSVSVPVQSRHRFRSRTRALFLFIMALFLAFLVAGPQVLPALQLSHYSIRSHGIAAQYLAGGALNLRDLASIVVPGWGRWFHPGFGYWETTGYIGPVMAGLAVASGLYKTTKDRHLLLFAALFLLAGSTLAVPVLARLPILHDLRVPSRFVGPASILMVLAGVSAYEHIQNTLWRNLLLFLALLSCLVPAWGLVPVRQSVQPVYPGGLVRLFRQYSPPYRVISELPHRWNMGIQYGFLHLGGNEPLVTYRAALIDRALSIPNGQDRLGVIGPWPGQSVYSILWDLYGVKFALVNKAFSVPAGLKIIRRGRNFMLVENPRALPIAYQVPCAVAARSHGRTPWPATSKSKSGLLYLDGPPGLPCNGQNKSVVRAAGIVKFTPEDITIRVNAPGPGYLVLSQTPYPGWSARVDGRDARIEPGNIASMAVRLGPGHHHQVHFHYTSLMFYAGIFLALAGMMLATVFAYLGMFIAPRGLNPWTKSLD